MGMALFNPSGGRSSFKASSAGGDGEDRGAGSPRSSNNTGSRKRTGSTEAGCFFCFSNSATKRSPVRSPGTRDTARGILQTASFGRVSAKTQQFMDRAYSEAVECRNTSRTFRRRTGKRRLCGNQPKGACYAGVKDAMLAVYGGPRPGLLHARQAHTSAQGRNYFAKKGFKNNTSVRNPRNAPPGSVIVYSGGASGHIEVVVIKNGQRMYCSDFCASSPISERISRRMIAAYEPPG